MGRNVTGDEELRFRQAMPVAEMVVYRSGDAFPLCPRCGSALEREYQRFCDRCGQRLDWKHYDRVRVIMKP